MKPVTADQMRMIDVIAQRDYKISQAALMENAGRAAFSEVKKIAAARNSSEVAVFAGRGNNGGDGFVLARYLYNMGFCLTVFIPGEGAFREGSTADNYQTIKRMGISIKPYDASPKVLEAGFCVLCVDALFGTGFNGQLPPAIQEISRVIRGASQPVISLDLPSGLDATEGTVSENCFKADVTVSFGLPKTGFYKNEGPSVCGDIINKDIGFPQELLNEYL